MMTTTMTIATTTITVTTATNEGRRHPRGSSCHRRASSLPGRESRRLATARMARTRRLRSRLTRQSRCRSRPRSPVQGPGLAPGSASPSRPPRCPQRRSDARLAPPRRGTDVRGADPVLLGGDRGLEADPLAVRRHPPAPVGVVFVHAVLAVPVRGPHAHHGTADAPWARQGIAGGLVQQPRCMTAISICRWQGC